MRNASTANTGGGLLSQRHYLNRPASMRIVQLTTDNREQLSCHSADTPHFGTAPEALLQGFSGMSDVEVHVISCTTEPMTSPEKLAPNIWFHSIHVPKLGWGRSLFLGTALATRRLIKRLNPDIVHGQGTERDCAMNAVLSGRPNILTIHGNMRVHATRAEQAGSTYYKLAAALETFCLKRTQGVVAISSYTEQLVTSVTPRTWPLPNAVDERYFNIERAPSSIPTILFIGTINERKNPVGLIDACEPLLRSGKCKIHFAGDGDRHSPYWEQFSHRLQTIPGLELLGFISREAIGLELARATMVVLPTFEDNCPMVVLESMAAGVAVSASRVGGVPDLIEHEIDGLMFEPSAPHEIRGTVERLIDDNELRERLEAAAKAKAVARFHPKVIARGHLEIYHDLLGIG
jgi:glycosyltransferase involved in cell wall biosynthesis